MTTENERQSGSKRIRKQIRVAFGKNVCKLAHFWWYRPACKFRNQLRNVQLAGASYLPTATRPTMATSAETSRAALGPFCRTMATLAGTSRASTTRHAGGAPTNAAARAPPSNTSRCCAAHTSRSTPSPAKNHKTRLTVPATGAILRRRLRAPRPVSLTSRNCHFSWFDDRKYVKLYSNLMNGMAVQKKIRLSGGKNISKLNFTEVQLLIFTFRDLRTRELAGFS